MYETHVQYEDQVLLKERDVEKMNMFIKTLMVTIQSTAKTEIDLGIRVREIDYINHEMAILQSKYDALEKRNRMMEEDMKNNKKQMKDMSELEQRHLKENVAERNKNQVMTRRIDGLEKGLLILSE
jgi:hypothetical protein